MSLVFARCPSGTAKNWLFSTLLHALEATLSKGCTLNIHGGGKTQLFTLYFARRGLRHLWRKYFAYSNYPRDRNFITRLLRRGPQGKGIDRARNGNPADPQIIRAPRMADDLLQIKRSHSARIFKPFSLEHTATPAAPEAKSKLS